MYIVDGKRIEAQWIAPPVTGKPSIVMLHEGLGSISMWRDFPDRLAARTGCGVFAYSRYGHGNSERLAGKRGVDYLHREAEVALPELLAEAAIEHPILLGHSDGASIALIYAGKYPDSPRALILEAPHVFVEDFALDGIRRTRLAYQTTDLGRRLARHHAWPDDTFRAWQEIWLDPRFRSWNIEAYLDSIRCPVLMIQGENDEYGGAHQIAAIASRVQSEVLSLDACGHSPHRDQPEAVLDRIARFVATARTQSAH
ncbi:MAG TPA: alpha/beta hydrolase [Bryobacteraceae bacterium]|nr:alpha/beta hydrolase [Bryobacteraceae bacterium]